MPAAVPDRGAIVGVNVADRRFGSIKSLIPLQMSDANTGGGRCASAVETPGDIHAATRSIMALSPTLMHLECEVRDAVPLGTVVARGHFTPEEGAQICHWFARYLTARAGLLETIDDLRTVTEGRVEDVDFNRHLELFLVAYTAAALLVRARRCLVNDVAVHRTVQRKLNEPEPRCRMLGKQSRPSVGR